MPVGIPIDILSSITETVKNNIIATMTKGHNDKDNEHDDDDDDDDDDDTNQNRNAKVTSNEQKKLVGGFNPSETYSPSRRWKSKKMKPPPTRWAPTIVIYGVRTQYK